MSQIFTETRNLYGPSTNWPSYVYLPVDGDPFVAASANAFETVLLDRDHLVLHSMAKLPPSNSIIKVSSTNGTTVVIHPYNLFTNIGANVYFSKLKTNYTINSSFLNPAGSFANNTWYYVYLNTTSMGFEINTTGPDPFNLYQSDGMGGQDLSKKFICSFRTNGAAAIIPFKKTGDYVNYITERQIITSSLMVKTQVNLAPFLPPHSRLLYTAILVESTAPDVINGASLYDPHEVTKDVTFIIRKKTGYPNFRTNTCYVWTANDDTPGTQTQSYIVESINTTLYVTAVGYWE